MLLRNVRFLTPPASSGGLFLLTTSELGLRTYACSTANEELHEIRAVACPMFTPRFFSRVEPGSPTLLLVQENEQHKLLEVDADTLAEIRSITFNGAIVRVLCSPSLVAVLVRGSPRASVHLYRVSPAGGLDPCPPDLIVRAESAGASCISLSASWLAVTTRTLGHVCLLNPAGGDDGVRDIAVSSSDVTLVKLTGGFLVTADESGLKLKLWNPQTAKSETDKLAVFRIGTNLALDRGQRVLDVAISHDGAFLFASTMSKSCYVFDLAKGMAEVRGREGSWINAVLPWESYTEASGSLALEGDAAAATVKEVEFDAIGHLHMATNKGYYGVYSVSKATDGSISVLMIPRYTNSIM